ncbi:hypothetical protein [Bacillus subtilis]|uniref:hypothetical protein n=1 Tax=Bacillus subtilis TaxID=1423 RepID=UPI001A944D0E|nr:hypothetical protein [Bacillus subtilis]
MASKIKVCAKYAHNDEDIDWDTERSFLDVLQSLPNGLRPYNFRLWDYVEEEWITVVTYDSHKSTVTVKDDHGHSWSEDWMSNYWLHCDFMLSPSPGHYQAVLPLSERTSVLMDVAKTCGIPATRLLTNPHMDRMVLKEQS